jgi:TPR repeat protein
VDLLNFHSSVISTPLQLHHPNPAARATKTQDSRIQSVAALVSLTIPSWRFEILWFPASAIQIFNSVVHVYFQSGSNLVASSQAAPSESSIYSNEVSHSVANVVSASELAIVDSNALNSSHASAMYQRALILEDPIQASRWFHCAAELGNADAVLKIAKQFEPDDCDENSSLEAVSWFRRAAELGEITAMFKLGICYEKGIGVVKDLQQAVVWYRQAADLGHANAMCNLAAVLKNGIGIAKDASAAVSWYQRAAELGHVGAINVIDSINGLEPPSSSVASVSGTKNGIIAAAAKKTKRTRTQWNESYRSSIHQVLKQVHPDKSISKKGMAVVNSIMNDMFVRIASEAGKLAQYNGKSILTSREIQIAVRLLLTGTLSKFAVSDGKKTMIRYRNSSQ